MSDQLHNIFMPEHFAPLLEAVRLKLAANFGVTVQGHHLTLRCLIDGRHTEVALLVSEISQLQPCCDGCSQPFNEGQHRYPVKAKTTHDGQTVRTETLEICGECAK